MTFCRLESKLLLHRRAIFTKYNQISTFSKFWKMLMLDEDKIRTPPYSHLVQIGDPVLRQASKEVDTNNIKSKEIQDVIEKMKKALQTYHLVGIAAPQVGIPYRIIMLEFIEALKKKYAKDVYENREMETLPFYTFINPILKVKNFDKVIYPEGCGSVCGYVGEVSRYKEVLLTGLNENGEPSELHLKGWNARIAQHEIDHLNGQVFVDIMEKKSFQCATWEEVNFYGGQLSIPFYPKKNNFNIVK